jgi:hypothetical protein
VPTKKQRKRLEKGRRHEYETVWVDSEGNELEEPPDDAPAPGRSRRSEARSGDKKPQQKRPQQRSARTRPDPLPPSWRRAARRSLLLGGVILVFFSLLYGIARGITFGLVYTILFIPFTYGIDRLAYNRWLKNQSPKKPAKR